MTIYLYVLIFRVCHQKVSWKHSLWHRHKDKQKDTWELLYISQYSWWKACQQPCAISL